MFKPESYRRGGLFSTVLQGAAQGLALVFNMVMATCFGAIVATDVFNYCTTTFAVVASFMLILNTTVLIPEAMRRRHQDSEEASMAFLNFFLFFFIAIALVISAIALGNPIGFLTRISQFDPALLAANREIILWAIPLFALQLVVQYMQCILVSYKFFSLPAVWGVLCRILNILYVLLFYQRLGVIALAQSLLIGLALQLIVSFWLMRRQLGWRFGSWRPRIGGRVWRNIAYTEVGLLAFAAASFTPVLMASAAAEGMVTAMNYAVKISAMLQTLIVGQVSMIVGIKLNELAARRDMTEFEVSYERIARLMVWVCAPIAFLLCVTAPDILTLLFMRGAYTADSVRITTALFQGLVLTLPMGVFHALLMQGMAAQQKVLFRNLMQIALSLLLATSYWLLVPKIGILRYPWIQFSYVFLFYFAASPLIVRFIPHIPFFRVLGLLMVNVLANAALAGACWVAALYAQSWPLWIRLGATVSLYGTGFILLSLTVPWDRVARDYLVHFMISGIQQWRNIRR
jgi:peptidoglycan biosynthesis protein MviN/MurJ (putative lipid II flippase)